MQRRHLRREYVSFRHGGNQSPTKAGIPPCRLSAHILSYGFSVPLLKGKHSFSSLPSHPNFTRFYRCASILFFGSYVLFCLTSLTAVHFICGLALSLRVHSFVLLIFEYVLFQRNESQISHMSNKKGSAVSDTAFSAYNYNYLIALKASSRS